MRKRMRGGGQAQWVDNLFVHAWHRANSVCYRSDKVSFKIQLTNQVVDRLLQRAPIHRCDSNDRHHPKYNDIRTLASSLELEFRAGDSGFVRMQVAARHRTTS